MPMRHVLLGTNTCGASYKHESTWIHSGRHIYSYIVTWIHYVIRYLITSQFLEDHKSCTTPSTSMVAKTSAGGLLGRADEREDGITIKALTKHMHELPPIM